MCIIYLFYVSYVCVNQYTAQVQVQYPHLYIVLYILLLYTLHAYMQRTCICLYTSHMYAMSSSSPSLMASVSLCRCVSMWGTQTHIHHEWVMAHIDCKHVYSFITNRAMAHVVYWCIHSPIRCHVCTHLSRMSHGAHCVVMCAPPLLHQ